MDIEKRMKTSVYTGSLLLPSAHAAGSGAEHGGGPEKHDFGVENWLAKPGGGRKSAKGPGRTNLTP